MWVLHSTEAAEEKEVAEAKEEFVEKIAEKRKAQQEQIPGRDKRRREEQKFKEEGEEWAKKVTAFNEELQLLAKDRDRYFDRSSRPGVGVGGSLSRAKIEGLLLCLSDDVTPKAAADLPEEKAEEKVKEAARKRAVIPVALALGTIESLDEHAGAAAPGLCSPNQVRALSNKDKEGIVKQGLMLKIDLWGDKAKKFLEDNKDKMSETLGDTQKGMMSLAGTQKGAMSGMSASHSPRSPPPCPQCGDSPALRSHPTPRAPTAAMA
eukprot:gene39947-57335_t